LNLEFELFPYDGPTADFASLTGSLLWNLSIAETVEAFLARGWRHDFGDRVNTPYGMGPEVHLFRLPGGREVIWIPSYGNIYGLPEVSREPIQRAYWILWKAGVRVLLIGGLSGVCDWRDGASCLRPGDFVLPWSFRTHEDHWGLPGTAYDATWPEYNVFLEEPFCPALSAVVADIAGEFSEKGVIGRVYTPETLRAALVHVKTIAFETDYDILLYRVWNKLASQIDPKLPSVVSLHGDCVNPVLARFLGIHLVYYHVVSNVAQGIEPGGDIHNTFINLVLEKCPKMAIELEGRLFENWCLPDAPVCRCVERVERNPERFLKAITGGMKK
jgi:hypothetical protein